MMICRFSTEENPVPRYGLLSESRVFPLPGEPWHSLHLNQRLPVPDYGRGEEQDTPARHYPLSSCRLQAPVTPSKIVCVGRNYREHAAELGNPMPAEPLLFLKAPSSLIGPDEAILLPPESSQVEHEGELGVVIGRTARRLGAGDNPLDYVLGYTCVNDVTARDVQRRDVQFTRGKSFDTFCPVGPFLVTGLDPLQLDVTTRLNGQVRQFGQTSSMAFAVPHLIRYISCAMTLYPGDLIATGTPAGVARMIPGDLVEVEISGLGVLRNPVQAL